MNQKRRSSIIVDPERIIPAFSLPWIHRDSWNDKEWFYSVEGVWYLKSSENMEEVLQLCGAGPNTMSMVLSSDMMISIQEDVSYHWWVRYEYRIKGKNHAGFTSSTYKMTSNKFFPGKEQPESLDDWDKRFTVSTISLVKDSNSADIDDISLVLDQVAEKDVKFRNDSKTVFLVKDEELHMITTVQTKSRPVTGTRTFGMYNLDNLGDTMILKGGGRFGLSPNVSRRGSFMTPRRASFENSGELQVPSSIDGNRRLSVTKVPDHLLPKAPVIEISEYK